MKNFLGSISLLFLFVIKVNAQIVNTIYGGFKDTIATLAVCVQPQSFTIDSRGNYYVSDFSQSLVYKSLPGRTLLRRYAGSGYRGIGANNVSALSSQLSWPYGVTTDTIGNLYIADNANNRIRKVDTSGNITLVAGVGSGGISGDNGPAVSATLNNPRGIVLDSAGNIYFNDYGNFRIRKISPAGIITTVAGIGNPGINGFSGDGGPATAARISWSAALAFDRSHNLYIADGGNNRIRKIDNAGIITTIAGTGTAGFSGDGGLATAAALSNPSGICVDSLGNIYISDGERIRKINSSGIISTIAGNGLRGFSGDGGPASVAMLSMPTTLFTKAGELYICDLGNGRVRKINTSGTISTVLGNGNGDGGPAIIALSQSPDGLASDRNGGIYVCAGTFYTPASAVRHIDAAGYISTIAGTGTPGYSGDGGPATVAQVHNPNGLAVDTSGNIFISDNENYCIRKINNAGTITTVAGIPTVYGYSGDGGPATAAKLNRPTGIAVSQSGILYIADYYNNRIRRVNAAGIISTVVGGFPPGYSGDGGPASNAKINSPSGVAVDRKGNVYVAELYGYRIRKIDTAGIITTYAGTGVSGFSGDGGPATSAQLGRPGIIVVDSIGNLFIVDHVNDRIRKVDTSGIITTFIGSGAAGITGEGTPALLTVANNPRALMVDESGRVVYSDNNMRVRMTCPAVPMQPDVTITANPGNINPAGTRVTFTAQVVNAGYRPQLQWKKNGFNVGNGLPVYIDSSLAEGDNVYCVMTANDPCEEYPLVNSDTVQLHISNLGVSATLKNTLNVYPNPATSFVHVSGLSAGAHITLRDMLGRTVHNATNLSSQKGEYTLDVQKAPEGIYLIVVDDPKIGRRVFQLMKAR